MERLQTLDQQPFVGARHAREFAGMDWAPPPAPTFNLLPQFP